MKQFEAGNSIKLIFQFHDFDGSVIDPDSDPEITILDINDNEMLSKTSMISQSNGTYYYIWSCDTEGIYKARVTGKINGNDVVKEKKFKIKRDD